MRELMPSVVTLSMLALCLWLLVAAVAGTVSQLNAAVLVPHLEAHR